MPQVIDPDAERQVYERTRTEIGGPALADDAVTDIVIELSAKAAGLLHHRARGFRLGTVGELRAIARLAAEGLAAAGADAASAPEPAAEESPLRPVDPDSPAGKVAADLSELLGEHIGPWSGVRSGGIIASPRGSRQRLVDDLNAVKSLLPDSTVHARTGMVNSSFLFVHLSAVLDAIQVEVSTCAGSGDCWVEDRAALESWLAELGVEVTA